MRTTTSGAIVLLAVLLCAPVATAQGAPGRDEAPPPPPLSDDKVAPPPPPPLSDDKVAPPPPLSGACLPACRDGYMCLDGRCVEACNPPCPAGSRCTGTAQCVSDMPPPPPSYASTPPAYPEPETPVIPPPDPGAERHDGFLLRLTIGFGGGAAQEEIGSTKADYSGAAGSFSVDLGGSVAENLVLHARISDFAIIDPSVTVEDPLFGTMDFGTAENVSLAFVLFGPALTYYIMPANVYVTGAIGLSWASVSTDQDSESTDAGVGVNVDIGKEWWVGDNWGLGLAGRFGFSHVSEDTATSTATLDFFAGGLLFSATYQ